MEVGSVVLRECPRKHIGDDEAAIRGILDAAYWADKGILPVAGGWEDQAAACMDGIRCAWSAKRAIENRLKAGKGEL